MREILLSESDRKRFDEFPADISQDDLIVFFTLSIIDEQLVSNRRGAANRLGFAVQLCAVRYLGYCPDNFADIPENIVIYIADQLDMEYSDNLIEEYGNRHQTRTDHLQEIISFIGFKKPGRKDFESLEHWLTERSLEHDKPAFLFSLACEHLYKARILRPGITVLERLIVSARRQTYNTMLHLLKPDVRDFLDELLTVDEETGRTPFHWLKFGATANKPADILNDIDKLEYLDKHNVGHWKITGLNSNKLKFLAQLARRSTNQSLRRSASERRYPILVAFVLRSYEEITDELIDLYDRCLSDCYARAKGDLKRFRLSISKSANEKLRIFKNIGDVVLNARVSDSEVRKKIYAVISEQEFRQAIDECGCLIRPKNDASYDFFGKRYSYIRKFSPRFLKIIRFSSNRENDPIVNAVSVLNKVNDENKRGIPDDAPTEFIRKSWLPHIKDDQGKIVRRYYEISVLWSLRGALRSGDIWVDHSRRHADPESYLIPKELWPSMKEEACKILGLPLSADTRLESKQRELEAAYRELDEKIGRRDGISIENDKLSVTRLKAEEMPISAKELQATITGRLPKIDIADLLIEVEQ